MERLFPRKKLLPPAPPPALSLLSQLLENQVEAAANPWLEYARFHGSGCADPKMVKAVAIFCPMTQVKKILLYTKKCSEQVYRYLQVQEFTVNCFNNIRYAMKLKDPSCLPDGPD
jgi:hypothetical protein